LPDVEIPVAPARRASLLWLRSAVAAAIVGVVAFFYRFNALGGALGGFGNDHFIHLSRARQIVAGELPFRDFSDPGAPLTAGLSAVAQWLLGYNLYSEALLTVGALSLGAAITTWLAARLTGRVWPGVLVALLQIGLAPRLYNHAKVLLFACGIWAAWRYADEPRRGRLLALALLIAFGFLVRHDYAIYLGVLGAASVALTHRQALTRAARRTAALTALTLLLLVPFLVFLQVSGGVVAYFRQAAEFAKADTARTSFRFPRFDVQPSGSLVWLAPIDAGPSPHVNVRWADGLPDETRAQLEATHGLVNGEHREGTTWVYEVADTSSRNIEALVKDARVLDTHGIDRAEYKVTVPQAEQGGAATIARLRLAPELSSTANAVAWLYYAMVAVPLVAAIAWVWRFRSAAYDRARMRQAVPVLWPLVIMMALLAVGFLSRGTIEARLADVAVPAGLLVAWLLCPRNERVPGLAPAARVRTIVRAGATLVLFVSAWSIGVLGAVTATADRSGFVDGPTKIADRSRTVRETLSASPPVLSLRGEAQRPFARLASWVHRCTSPSDRLLVIGNMPELYFFSGRLMAGGHAWFVPGYATSREAQLQTIARARSHRVPLVLTDTALYETNYKPEFPLIDEYLQSAYVDAGRFALGDTAGVNVMLARGAGWTETDPETGLPCGRPVAALR
jgi:hypothetical protein